MCIMHKKSKIVVLGDLKNETPTNYIGVVSAIYPPMAKLEKHYNLQEP